MAWDVYHDFSCFVKSSHSKAFLGSEVYSSYFMLLILGCHEGVISSFCPEVYLRAYSAHIVISYFDVEAEVTFLYFDCGVHRGAGVVFLGHDLDL